MAIASALRLLGPLVIDFVELAERLTVRTHVLSAWMQEGFPDVACPRCHEPLSRKDDGSYEAPARTASQWKCEAKVRKSGDVNKMGVG